MFWTNTSLVWTYSSGVLLYVAMQLARTSPVCSLFVSSLECVKVPWRRASWLSAPCFIREESKRLVLVIGVRTVVNHLYPHSSPFNRFNEWNRFESIVSLFSQSLINFIAQIIISFISFGSLHIHTKGFQSWQWYDWAQHLTMTLTFP